MTHAGARTQGVLVSDLTVELTDGTPIVSDISLEIDPGELLGIVGESGSGKSTVALAMLGYAKPGGRIASGQVSIAGSRLDLEDEAANRQLRSVLVSFVPQDPGSALNPSRRIGKAISALLRHHRIERDPGEILAIAELPGDAAFRVRYPHQLSGGQQQRVVIGLSMACRPEAIVFDEPTTGLDVVTQKRFLERIDRLRQQTGTSIAYVTHDLGVVANIAQQIAVMYAGRIVEHGPVEQVLGEPRHPYTRGLLQSIPDHREPQRVTSMPGVAVSVGERPGGCSFAPRCPQATDMCTEQAPEMVEIGPKHHARCFYASSTPASEAPALRSGETAAPNCEPLLEVRGLLAQYGQGSTAVVVAEDVSFSIQRGRVMAMVGESGSGKTTIARCISGLHEPEAGEIVFEGEPLATHTKHRSNEQRRRIRMVFQNPSQALNPYERVEDAIGRPVAFFGQTTKRARRAAVQQLLDLVRLPARVARYYPRDLSGGERQRVAIAGALAGEPDLLICDEITSALDVSVQAAVLEVLDDLRNDLGLTLLFVTHNLGVVAAIADDIVVLDKGSIVEAGPALSVLAGPASPFTRRLFDSAPSASDVRRRPTMERSVPVDPNPRRPEPEASPPDLAR